MCPLSEPPPQPAAGAGRTTTEGNQSALPFYDLGILQYAASVTYQSHQDETLRRFASRLYTCACVKMQAEVF